MIDLKTGDDCIEFSIRVTPKSHRDKVVGPTEGVLRLAVRAAPVEGEANRAVVKTLSKALGVPKSSISITAGQSSRNKRIRITGLKAAELIKRLGIDRD